MYKKEANGAMATLFISYATCDRPIVDIIQNKISEKLYSKIKISRFDNLNYKDSFKAFMNTIGEHDFVLAVVSDTYLKSKACMYEISEVLRDHHYKDKLLFVVLSETERIFYKNDAPKSIGADIYSGAKSRLNYIIFWEKQYNELNERIKQVISEESKKDCIDELQIIGQIYRKDIGEFLQFLSDENGKTFKELYDEEFEDIIQLIAKPLNLQQNMSKILIDPQLEELYHQFPQNTEIAISLAKFLFKLSQKADSHVVSFVVDYLESIYSEHPCEDIAILLAMSLTNLSVTQDYQEIQKTESRIKNLYSQYSNNLEMAIVYTKCLVNCTRDDETVAKAAITQLQELYNQYASNAEILINYASGLSNMCFLQNTQEIINTVACLEELYIHYPNMSELAIKYAQGLKILSNNQNVSDAIFTSDRIKQLCTQNPNIIDIAVFYAQCLTNLIVKEPRQGISDILAQIENLHNQYPNEPRITSQFAVGLNNYQLTQENIEDAMKCTERMENLYFKYSDIAATSIGLARCFVDLSAKQNKESERLYIATRLEYLYNQHPNEEIATAYAICLYNLSIKQNKGSVPSTLMRLEELHKRYPDNERIASELACSREACLF